MKKAFGIVFTASVVVVVVAGILYVGQMLYTRHVSCSVNDGFSVEFFEEPPVHQSVDQLLLRRFVLPDTAALWLSVPDTTIDAPVMKEQVVDSYFYGNHLPDGTYSNAGSFFMPACESPTDVGLILGHRMLNFGKEWMFSDLPDHWGESAKEYPYIYTYTNECSTRWRVMSAMDTPAADMLYDMPYTLNTPEYVSLIEHITTNARYVEGDIAPDKPMLVLSTCNGAASMRFAVVAVPDAVYYYESESYSLLS